MAWADDFLNDLSQQTGASVESSDLARLAEYERGVAAGTTTQAQLTQFMDDLRVQYIKRGASTAHRKQDSQSGLYTDVGGDPQQEPGFREDRDTSQPLFGNGGVSASYAPSPPLPISSKLTTLGASPAGSVTPTVGPVGLAYPDDPINYATMQQSPAYGYSSGGALPSGVYPSAAPAILGPTGAAGGTDNTMIYLMLAAAAVAAYFLLK